MAFSAYEYSEEFVGANNLNINTTKIETYNKRFLMSQDQIPPRVLEL